MKYETFHSKTLELSTKYGSLHPDKNDYKSRGQILALSFCSH